ncbi:MAG: 4Fe-4S binding protein [Bacillota bacterium]|nr:4Fe-4S binding protein [Bacillota bacterium]
MKISNKYLLKRSIWYLAGFVMFYAPFALFQKLLISTFGLTGNTDIHGACFRMGIQGLFTGKSLNLLTTSGIIVLLLLVSALLIGPIFCGRFCIAGAFSEYLSRIVPEKFKFNWQKHLDPTPVRYGVLAGFLIGPFFGLSAMCAYCNYSFFQKLTLGITTFDLGVLGSTTILTAFIWLIVLGAFAKGGRGYCSYLCPIGATQSLLHSIGAKLGITYKLRYSPEKCANCNLCVKDCPMGALQSSKNGLKYNIHNCITCHQCEHVCPKKAISYGRGKGNWDKNNTSNQKINLPEVTV